MKTKFEKKTVFDVAHVLPRKYKNLHNIPHWHKEHELIFVQSGEALICASNSTFSLSQGMSAFFHAEDTHSIDATPETVITVIKVEPSFFHRIIGDKRLASPILSDNYQLSDRLAELFAELKEPLEYGGIVADSITTTLLARIFREEETATQGTARRDATEQFKGLLELIAQSYPYLTFEDAAQYMHFSKPYFSEFFLSRAGMTFTQYLNLTKISNAVERVLEGKLSVTEISKSCGFNTIRNFNRVFKELTGYTPSELPKDYHFTHSPKEYTDSGFDPTLVGSELLET